MKTILCVDDIEANLYTLKAIFDSYGGDYNIIIASSGYDALSILLKHDIDLILLDIMMPELDGFESAKLILGNKKTKDIPIIFLTANKDSTTISRCYRVGGVDYLNKPYNEVELLERVKFHLEFSAQSKKLKEEKELAQNILNLQDNIVFISDGKNMLSANNTTFNFFDVKNFEEFISRYECICTTFIKDDSYFSLDKVSDNQLWVDVLINNLNSRTCSVLIMDIKTLKPKAFAIKAKKLTNNYLVSLTDITSISLESKKFEHEASYDALTKIFNRNKFHYLFQEQEKILKRSNLNNLSFIILDIDNFKMVNDTYGHNVGDDVLVHLSNLIKSNIRGSDIFARWGGEEFVILLPNININKAKDIAENLRVIVESEPFDIVDNITCSFGVSTFVEFDTLETLVKRADDALYQAKESGRNRVCQSN